MRRPGFLPSVVLFLFTCLLMFYRILWLGYPALPMVKGQTWQIVVDVFVTPKEEQELLLKLALPAEHTGYMVSEERFLSGRYALNTVTEGANRFAVWSEKGLNRPDRITYRATIHSRSRRSVTEQSPAVGPFPPALNREERSLAEGVAGRWQAMSPPTRFQAAVKALGNEEEPPADDYLLRRWRVVQQKHDPTDAALTLFAASGLPARPVEGLRLAGGVQILPTKWIEVWVGEAWLQLSPETGKVYPSSPALLPLAIGGLPAVSVTGGALSDIRWTLSRQVVSQWNYFYEHIARSPHFLDRWSLLQLPQEFQGTFRILLLVPIGALIIALMRNLIGLPTFGIFMPLLIALAFRNTGTVYGVSIFCGVLLVGYAARSFLDKLHLLLVPRLSVILTLVIACFTLLALVGNKLGLRELMAVGLIPFVILTMTIERFFILIEESGSGEALRTALGSVAVAVIAYGIISWEPLQLTFFVYPELILTVAALQILLGRYTGYRLVELYRFRNLKGAK